MLAILDAEDMVDDQQVALDADVARILGQAKVDI